jgi:hypothetical protein
LIEILLFLFIVVLPLIGKVLNKLQRLNRPTAERPLRPLPPPPDVAKEIDDFLEQKRRNPGTRRAAERARAKQSAPPTRSITKPVRAEVVAEKPIGEEVTEHVKKYLDENTFSERARQLGGDVAKADQAIDQHLHQKFDHRVSRLETVPGETAIPPTVGKSEELAGVAPESFIEATPTLLIGLFEQMNSPESLAQIVILNEILRRPDEQTLW